MSLYVVHVEIVDNWITHADRIVGPYRSEDAAQKVADVIRGRVYTRLVKRRALLGQTGRYGDQIKVDAVVRQLHNEAAKHHYDWLEDTVLKLIDER